MSQPSPEPDLTGAYQPAPQPLAERFAPGVLLANRYRIVAPLGKGGMGEVYRADDLTLAQPVALKFLPQHIANDPDRLARFRKEVAAARGVSHPNVCRVYDITEHDGQSFLTMEFIDGEDLSSVLKRLGRVPEEKGTEIARQLCSALSAVHDAGLLHRDLKPANVMLDGRGKVRLTDFGLAAAEADLSVSDVRSGTPLYQAPEQLAGREVTVRSDIYALGLVLYELFTGKRAFADAKRDTTPLKPSAHISNLNPEVEAIVLRCLEPEPANRPRSAPEVLASLPGGDPLAAALAAGQTPSPQLVADAGGTGLISVRFGLLHFASVVGSFLFLAFVADQQSVYRRAAITTPPAEMTRTAEATLGKLGHANPPAHATGRYEANWDWLVQAQKRDADWLQKIGDRPGGMVYFYRASPEPMPPKATNSEEYGSTRLVSWSNPPASTPGTVAMRLDSRGRLLEYYAVPPTRAEDASTTNDDWVKPLFSAAGLDPARFTRAESQATPPVVCDRQITWTGTWDANPDTPIRVEAAALRGKPVWFRIEVARPGTAAPPTRERSVPIARVVIFLFFFGLACLLAFRNVRRKRGDWKTARRYWFAVLGLCVLFDLVGSPTTGSVRADIDALVEFALVIGAVAGVTVLAYIAMEPTVRRRWPWRLTAWNRLFAGRWRDPMVGRDLLIGFAAGSVVWSVHAGASLLCDRFGIPAPQRAVGMEEAYPPGPLLDTLGALIPAMISTPMQLFWAFCIFLVVRREWLAWVLYAIIFWFVWTTFWSERVAESARPVAYAQSAVLPAVIALVFARYGLLAVVGISITGIFAHLPYTFDTSAWYFPQAAIGTGLFVALAGFCLWTATGAKPLFKEGFFGDD